MNSPDPSPAPQKSGLSCAALAAIGGSVIALLVLIGVAIAIFDEVRTVHLSVVKADAGSDPQSSNKATATLTVAGPDGTTVTSSDPTATLPPKWVPAYPAAQAQAGGTKKESKDTVSGTYFARTQDDPDKVKDYYDSTLKADGFETKVATANTDGSESTTVTATMDDRKRKIAVKASSEKGHTNLEITYEGAR
jgi:hypothetical protein